MARKYGLRQSTRPLTFFSSPRVGLLIFMMTATRTIAILLVMTIVAVNAKQLPRTRSKRVSVEIGGKASLLGM